MVKKEWLKQVVMLAIAGLLVVIITLPGLAAEFSADLLQKMEGQPPQTGKIFIKGKNMRMEIASSGGTMVHIILPEQNKTIMLMPKEKMYMEMVTTNTPGTAQPLDKAALGKLATLKHLGTETVNGYLCDKYEVAYHDASQGSATQWIAQKLNFPVKTISDSPQGNVTMEYQNIQEGGVQDSLFQVPPGYQKMSMPGMGSGMGYPMGE